MINDGPINGGPINAPGASASLPPVPTVPSSAYGWTVQITVGAEDLTGSVTGQIEIDREEGGAAVAGFRLFIDEGEVVVPTNWTGAPVTIDFISTRAGVTTTARRFTGTLQQPEWDPITRVMACGAGDGLQRRVEALSIEQIRALIPGHWSADVYEPTDGRSHWDFAVELLNSLPASLDCSPDGGLRLTSWFAADPAFEFGEGTTIYQSARVELADQGAITNFVGLDVSYRYARLREMSQTYRWTHPETAGIGGMGGFCLWRELASDLPNIDMILSAGSSAGQVVTSADWYRLPPTNPDPCGTGQPWISTENDLLLGASWTGKRRWVQTVTEKYQFQLYTPAGLVEANRVVQRRGSSFDIQAAAAEGWSESLRPVQINGDSIATGTPKPGFGPPGDRDDEPRRQAGLRCQMETARTELIDAHRRTTVSWQVPTNEALDVDLVHTLRLDDQGIRAEGKCRRIQDAWDLDSGSAITTISIASMRGGGGASTPLAIPERLGEDDEDDSGGVSPGDILPTQLGGRFESPEYDDEKLGYAGNYSLPQDPALPVFPRRMLVEAAEIPEEDTDERVYEGEFAYVVAIPDDLLEM